MWRQLKRLWLIATCNHPEPEVEYHEQRSLTGTLFRDPVNLSNGCKRCPRCNQWFPPPLDEPFDIEFGGQSLESLDRLSL